MAQDAQEVDDLFSLTGGFDFDPGAWEEILATAGAVGAAMSSEIDMTGTPDIPDGDVDMLTHPNAETDLPSLELGGLLLEVHLKQKRLALPIVPPFQVRASDAACIDDLFKTVSNHADIDTPGTLTHLNRLLRIEAYLPGDGSRSPSKVAFAKRCLGRRVQGRRVDEEWNDFLLVCAGYLGEGGCGNAPNCGNYQRWYRRAQRSRTSCETCSPLLSKARRGCSGARGIGLARHDKPD